MASWIDVFSLVVTTLFFVGSILGVLYAAHAMSSCLQSTKASLEGRGITVSRDGVSFKTQRRFDRDAYLDATQRGFVKALSSATVGHGSHQHALLPHSSSGSNLLGTQAASHPEKHVFGASLRRSQSGGRGEGH